MGTRNAKPPTDRDRSWKTTSNTSADDECHGPRTKQEDVDAGEGRQGRRYRGSKLRDGYIVGLRVLRGFSYCFRADFIWHDAVFPFIYCLIRETGVRIDLASARVSACIAITPLHS